MNGQLTQFRLAGPADAAAVAALHADSWRRHYRGAYSDEFLDGDVLANRSAVWAERLGESDPQRYTVIAEDGALIGFANTFFDDDPEWGALLDNLHVAEGRKRRGIGSRLMELTLAAVAARPQPTGLYLWVLEQNVDGQAFYDSHGGRRVEHCPAEPPGGIASRLAPGSPMKLRYAWPESAVRSYRANPS